jgi:hypothetical protein
VRDLAGNQHLAIVLIAFQGVVTIAPASAARLDQAARVTVQETAAGDDITSAAIRGIGRVLRSARGADEDQTNDCKLRRSQADFVHDSWLVHFRALKSD